MDMDSKKFVDESILYKNYKDLNDWIVNMGKAQKNRVNYMKP
jgi:hypothetical protein